jgi:hypothetical protein
VVGKGDIGMPVSPAAGVPRSRRSSASESSSDMGPAKPFKFGTFLKGINVIVRMVSNPSLCPGASIWDSAQSVLIVLLCSTKRTFTDARVCGSWEGHVSLGRRKPKTAPPIHRNSGQFEHANGRPLGLLCTADQP